MAKEFTEEMRLKAQAAIASKVAARKSSAIRFGDYTVRRVDDLNWGIEEPGKELRYYSDFEQAIRSLLHLKISNAARNDIETIIAAINRAEASILAAIKNKI